MGLKHTKIYTADWKRQYEFVKAATQRRSTETGICIAKNI